MSKELEAFERIKKWFPFRVNELEYADIALIETEFKEHEEYRQILNDYGLSLADFRHACFTFAQFKNSKGFEGVEKKLKSLEIIKEKEVNVQNFKNTCSTMSYEQYLFMWKDGCFMGIMMTSKTMLTQEEYDLLKEVLL